MTGLSAEILNNNGRPMLYINGQKVIPVIYGLSDIPASQSRTVQAQKNIKNFANQGINLVLLDAQIYKIWKKTDEFDLTMFREELRGILEANPAAYIIIRMHMNAPYWWMRDNPDEIVVYEDTKPIDGGEYERLIKDDFKPMMRVSVASKKWLKEGGELLARVCRELSTPDEGMRVIGIQIAGAFYGEWHQWAYFDHEPDYSLCMTRRYRSFLQEKYKSDEDLRKAWANTTASINWAFLSPSSTRLMTDQGCFRDPLHSRAAIDSLKCLQRTIPEAINHFAKVAKKNWCRSLLIGAFYGYFFNVGGNRATIGGHLETDLIFQENVIDFMSGPFPYMNNLKMSGIGLSRGLLESMRLHGILWLTEMDQEPIGTAEGFIGGDEKYHPETIALLRRNFMESITRGMGFWFYDHRIVPSGSLYQKNGWWDHPALLHEIHKLYDLSDTYTNQLYQPVADVVLVYDTEAYYHMPQNSFADASVEYSILHSIGHAGVSYDMVYLHDIDHIDWDRYKCVIFVNTVYIEDEVKTYIHQVIARNNRHIVWLYAPGYSNGKNLSTESVSDLIGITVQPITPEKEYTMCTNDFPDLSLSAKPLFDPMFKVHDSTADIIGKFSKSGLPAAARKRSSEYTAWYFSIPVLHEDIARIIFNQAGAHIYDDGGDAIMAGSNLLVVNSEKGGKRILKLLSGTNIQVDLHEASTSIYDSTTGLQVL